ncbi:MAG: hypothetical protein AAF938_05085 [Myxococcota bacterium]
MFFETNLAQDSAYRRERSAAVDSDGAPTGWDGVYSAGGEIRGVPGAGFAGGVAMKFEWAGGRAAQGVQLIKHLTGARETGYEELFVRYQVRLPDAFRAGRADEALAYWRWGMLLQRRGTEPRDWGVMGFHPRSIRWQWGNGLPRWGVRQRLIFGENFESNRPPMPLAEAGPDWFVSGGDEQGHHRRFDGHWDRMGAGAWEFDHQSRQLLSDARTWHTLEWRFRLSSSDTSNDGVFQLWFDGEEQVCPNAITGVEQDVDQASTNRSLITAASPGMNVLMVMGNVAGWNADWGEPGAEGGIYVNDVVVSTERIGHDYVVTRDGLGR